jgi:two-component system response regulator
MNKNPILLVEDDNDDVVLALRALKKGNILNEVVVVRDGVEALDYLFATGTYVGKDAGPLPAVVLLDLKMPRIDGMKVLRAIRADKRTRNLPVIILTSSNFEQDISDGVKLGADQYIQKPINPVWLKKTLSQWEL